MRRMIRPRSSRLGVVEAGGRLVEEHRIGLERERPGDVDEPLMACRQQVHRDVSRCSPSPTSTRQRMGVLVCGRVLAAASGQ